MKNTYFFILLSFLFTGCIYDDYVGPDSDQPTRTVLVYMSADDASLTKSLGQEVEQLRRGWTYTGNRCLIYVDTEESEPLLLSLRGGCATYPEPFIDTLAVYPEENSASAEVFARVVSEVVEKEPADSYGLIFVSHSSGWLPEGALSSPTRSLGSDMNPGMSVAGSTQMELSDFADAIPDDLFDFVIFESCLMAGVEVVFELADKTDYIVASSAELLQPGFINIYRSSLYHLFDTKKSVESNLKDFALAYRNHINTQTGAYNSATLSVIKTDKMKELASLTKEALSSCSFEDIADKTNLQHFDRPGSYGDVMALPRFFDFMECMEMVSSPGIYGSVDSLMNETVIWKYATPFFMTGYNGFEIKRHCGLTCYLEQPEYEKLNSFYRQTSWWKATR